MVHVLRAHSGSYNTWRAEFVSWQGVEVLDTADEVLARGALGDVRKIVSWSAGIPRVSPP